MNEKDFDKEFNEITAPLERQQSEEAKQDEIRIYRLEDGEFRRAIIDHIVRFTGVKTGKELFS